VSRGDDGPVVTRAPVAFTRLAPPTVAPSGISVEVGD
jgi:hypothetical protein